MPKFEGFNVLSQEQSSTFSLAASNIKTTLTFTYILAPKEKGKFKIEPAVIKLKDKVFSSAAFEKLKLPVITVPLSMIIILLCAIACRESI